MAQEQYSLSMQARKVLVLTDSVNKQLGLGGEVVVDDIIEHGDIDPSGRQVGHDHHQRAPVLELSDVDFPSRLVQRAVDVCAADICFR